LKFVLSVLQPDNHKPVCSKYPNYQTSIKFIKCCHKRLIKMDQIIGYQLFKEIIVNLMKKQFSKGKTDRTFPYMKNEYSN
jgi:hypothetical protein